MVCASTGGQVAPANHRFRRRVAVVALGLALGSGLATPVASAGPSSLPAVATFAPSDSATPALWEVSDGDTIIYLFGTFHALDDRTAWFDRSVHEAFDRSGEVVLETIAPDNSREISAAARAAIGPRPAPASFLGQTRLAVANGRGAGLSVDRGADAVLRRAATAQGKSLTGIEAFADQLRTFASISSLARPPLAPSPLANAAPSSPPVTLAALLTAWKAGDTRAFAAMLAGFEARAPAAYRLLIADRNALYGEWIAQRLARPGTVFVAVGAGHLAGKDSVQNWLLANGIRARRVG